MKEYELQLRELQKSIENNTLKKENAEAVLITVKQYLNKMPEIAALYFQTADMYDKYISSKENLPTLHECYDKSFSDRDDVLSEEFNIDLSKE